MWFCVGWVQKSQIKSRMELIFFIDIDNSSTDYHTKKYHGQHDQLDAEIQNTIKTIKTIYLAKKLERQPIFRASVSFCGLINLIQASGNRENILMIPKVCFSCIYRDHKAQLNSAKQQQAVYVVTEPLQLAIRRFPSYYIQFQQHFKDVSM